MKIKQDFSVQVDLRSKFLPLSESELSELSVFAALLSGSSELLACLRLLPDASFFILFFYEEKHRSIFSPR